MPSRGSVRRDCGFDRWFVHRKISWRVPPPCSKHIRETELSPKPPSFADCAGMVDTIAAVDVGQEIMQGGGFFSRGKPFEV